MKPKKNNILNFILFLSVIALMIIMLLILRQTSLLKQNNVLASLAIVLIVIIGTICAISIIRRIDSKKYIYLSYAASDRDTVEVIYETLTEQFKVLSKYSFEILSMDSIPFGNNIDDALQKNIEKADIAMWWCLKHIYKLKNVKKNLP